MNEPDNQAQTATTSQGSPSTETTEAAEVFQSTEETQQETTQTKEQQTPETPTPEAEAPAASLSKQDIIDILSQAGVGQRVAPTPQTQAAAAAETQMTPEQFEAAFNVFKPSEDLVRRLTDENAGVRIKAITELRDALVKQVMTMADYRMKQYSDHIRKNDIEPLRTYVSEAQARDWRDTFFKKYPDLEKHEIIVDAVATKLEQQGFTATSREAIMKRFAEDSRTVIKQLLAGNAAGAAGGNGAQPAKPQGRRMSTVTTGGQTGTSRPTSGSKTEYSGLAKEVASGLSVFDE
jgi:hypothetical protein